ncbi:MAG: hypothetical protein R3185_06335, partial [Candidatus Thermoplasmatota archaeon]|nr:hypothetical protein [Candidatus Thermoplasmatota archaeon]
MKAVHVRALLLGLIMITSVLALSPSVGAELSSPTLSGAPAIDGSVEEAEWGVAETFQFNSPRSGSSTLRLGYVAETGELAMGLVLADDTAQEAGSDKDHVEIFLTPEAPDDYTEREDRKFVIYRDGSWEVFQGHSNTTIGFSSSRLDSGSVPTTTDTDEWTFAIQRSAASWELEALIDIGSFDAGDAIATAVRQVDFDSSGEEKSSTRPSGFAEDDPTKWERTLLTGRPTVLQFSVSPTNMEAGVGGDIIAKLPADAAGGRLTVQVREPGGGGFIPIGTVQEAQPGNNRFHFAPLKTGSWSVQAVWNGDGKYGALTTDPQSITVARPTPAGVTVMETGSLRVAFPMEDAGSPAKWRYLNSEVRAEDGDGDTLNLVHLDKDNSCRSQPWVGLANMDEGPLVVHLDPPVLRAAVALTSPQGAFEANVQAYTSNGDLKTEVNGEGSCSQPLFASLGDTKDDVSRIEISYAGDDEREVVDVLFPHPQTSTEPQTIVRADPSPLHAGGTALLHISSGSPHRVTQTDITVRSGTRTIATETCDAAPAQAWIDCPVEVEIPTGSDELDISIRTKDRFGTTHANTHEIEVEDDTVPPQASLLPRPLMAGPGAAVALTASASDGSGIERIDMRAEDQDGNTLNEKTCEPESLSREYECVMGVSPPEDGVAYVTATYTDGAGNERTVGPKPIPVRDTDTDGDGLPDALENMIGT